MDVIRDTDGALMNHLLSALPVGEFAPLRNNLEPVSPGLGAVIYESGGQLDYVCFPTTALISLL